MQETIELADASSASAGDRGNRGNVLSEPQCPAGTTERRLLAKIDMRLIPVLFMVYLLAFLDRVNISNALTLGLPQELRLDDKTSQQSNIALAVFFVPYILLDIPANWLMKRLSPHVWISTCITLFGVFMLAQGFVRSFAALVVTRVLLGTAEAGILSGCFYLLGFYYRRHESQQRFTWFFSSSGIASGFGSLIASGIAMMGNMHGLSNWRWIFIIEGAVTIGYGIAAYFLIVDFPTNATWLHEDERRFVTTRVALDSGDDREPITIRGILRFFTHGKKVFGGVMYFCTLIPLYSITYFTPTIIRANFNVNLVQVQLLSIPPWACAVVWSFILSYMSDKMRMRFPFLLTSGLLGIIGIAILQSVHTGFSTRYAALIIMVMGVYAAGPLIVCWCSMNMRGHLDRAVGTAWIIGFGNVGGLIATFTLPAKDAPVFRKGFAIDQAGACLAVVTYTTYFVLCVEHNRKAKQQQAQHLLML